MNLEKTYISTEIKTPEINFDKYSAMFKYLISYIFLLHLSDAFAYRFTSDFQNGFYWESTPIKIEVEDNDQQRKQWIETLTREAIEEWHSATGLFLWEFSSQGGGVNKIRWSNQFTQETGMNSFSTLAVTVRYSQGPYFIKTEIIINGQNSSNQNSQSLRTILIHELGHTLGLDHSDNPQSVMYSNLIPVYRGLSADDLEGIEAVHQTTLKRQAERYVSPLAYTEVKTPASCGSMNGVGGQNIDQSMSFLISCLLGLIAVFFYRLLKFIFIQTKRSSYGKISK
jgi:hypothetical protein